MLKLSQRKNWITFLFATYGVPALLMIAVLPVTHKPACACLRTGALLMHEPLPTVYCPACAFNISTPLATAEPAVAISSFDGPLAGAMVVCDAPASRHLGLSRRAHSPPFA
ncbi:MAG: hypothetical protein HZB26_22330 [Candidatus Hydrogenedentes bacterium]|nr:hypothetical protein [Candidatus Hydrogenedentota bacterium]